jgi:hypothetical protein
MLALTLGYGRSHHGGDHISADFICLTNHPAGYLAALLRVTNQSDHIIWCEGYGFLEPNESGNAEVPLFASNDSDPVVMRWQCSDFSNFDSFMNSMRRRAQVLGVKPLRPWFPLVRTLEIPRTANGTEAEPDGAANGSQPIRSETNRASPAAGSRR